MKLKIATGLSPGMQYLLQQLKSASATAPVPPVLPGNNLSIDWKEFIQLAEWHKLVPLLYHQLPKTPKPGVPAWVLAHLENYYKKISINNLRHTQTLHRVLELLAKRGVEVIVIKGPALAMMAYGDVSMRMFTDLDFLAHLEDFPLIYDILSAAGFRSLVPFHEDTKKDWKHFRRDLEFTDGLNYLDFHPMIAPGLQGDSFWSSAWKKKMNIELISKDIPVLSPVFTLLSLCIDAIRNNWRYLGALADLAHLVNRHGSAGINWQELFDCARVMGCSRMLLIGLLMAEQVAGLEIPGEIAALGNKAQTARDLAGQFLSSSLAGRAGSGKYNEVSAVLKSLDSFSFRVKFFLRFLFQPTTRDQKKVPLPGCLFFLYYMIRPVRLLLNILRKSL